MRNACGAGLTCCGALVAVLAGCTSPNAGDPALPGNSAPNSLVGRNHDADSAASAQAETAGTAAADQADSATDPHVWQDVDYDLLDPPVDGLADSGPAKPANPWQGKTVFLMSLDNSSRWLQRIDVATAKTTNVCQLPQNGAYPSLTFRRDNVLVGSIKGAGLDEIDPCTCKIKAIGSYGGATVVNGITSNHAQGLYGVSSGLQALIEINPQSGMATTVGSGLGVAFGANGATWSDIGQNLLAINGKDDGLYAIDPKTGKAALLAKLSKPFASVGMERHPANDHLYACTDDKVLRDIDPKTGVVTEIGPIAQSSVCTNLAAPWVPFECP